MSHAALFPSSALLGPEFPLPLDRPFTLRQASRAGVSPKVLSRLRDAGLVRRLLKGIYVAAQAPDDLLLRARALQLVVPDGAAVVDWTAMWLHTGMLPFGHHLEVPPVAFFRPPGRGRLRNGLCVSGERAMAPTDLEILDGLLATTGLRTAWDIGRFSRRDDAIGGLDRLLRTGAFSHDELLDGVERFRKQRGVVQLRALAPLADPRAESPGESVLRLRWLDLTSLPRPTPQIPVVGTYGGSWRLDLGVEEIRFAVEYDGAEHHTSPEDLAHDERRRRWLETERGWVIEAVRRHHVFGQHQDIDRILIQGVRDARRTLSRRTVIR